MNRTTIEALADTGAKVATGDNAASHQVDGLSPEVVTYPTDLSQLSGVVKTAHERDLAVAPWGGGTQTTLGNTIERLDVVVDLSHLDRVVEHNPGDLTATLQAGTTVGRLQEVLGEHRQFLALDPPLPHRATVGGTLATAVSGPLKWQYGSPRDLVIGMKVVQADGRVTKSGGQVVKNVSGYDMARLHIGGLGTLGIIAEVSFKLTPLPAEQATVLAAYDSHRHSVDAALGIFRGDVVPLALTTFDSRANDRMQAIDARDGHLLAVRLGGRPLSLQRQIRECRSTCELHGTSRFEVLPEKTAATMWRRLADFAWDEGTAPTIGTRATLMPSRVPELVEELERSEGRGDLSPAIVCHPAQGTVLIGWYETGGGLTAEAATDALRYVRKSVQILEGKMVIERCPLDVKPQFDIWDDVGAPLSIMRRLKQQYDHKGILNPGRFAGGI